MKGDFTRNTFDKEKHFSRVLMQQGRMQLDADWNEQAAIMLHYLRTLAADLIGQHGGPKEYLGFKISEDQGDYYIGQGRYYVDGVSCENKQDVLFTEQLDCLPETNHTEPRLYYLDVWERLITYIEDDEIREVALNGPDTAVRSKVVWQVKTRLLDDILSCLNKEEDEDNLITLNGITRNYIDENWNIKVGDCIKNNTTGKLAARAKAVEKAEDYDPCITPPDSRYRGAENQLYRVEVHRSGTAWDGTTNDDSAATFKWSRENGAVTFPIRTISGKMVSVENLKQDSRFSLKKGDLIEIVDDDTVLAVKAEMLHKVDKIDFMTGTVTLADDVTIVKSDETKHPLLRRWDHKEENTVKKGLTLSDRAVLIEERTDKDEWQTLEDGVQIQFRAPEGGKTTWYRTGDYWLIPARTATGDIEWPKDENGISLAISSHGVEHHYAPLAIVKDSAPEDCRRQFEPEAKLVG